MPWRLGAYHHLKWWLWFGLNAVKRHVGGGIYCQKTEMEAKITILTKNLHFLKRKNTCRKGEIFEKHASLFRALKGNKSRFFFIYFWFKIRFFACLVWAGGFPNKAVFLRKNGAFFPQMPRFCRFLRVFVCYVGCWCRGGAVGGHLRAYRDIVVSFLLYNACARSTWKNGKFFMRHNLQNRLTKCGNYAIICSTGVICFVCVC